MQIKSTANDVNPKVVLEMAREKLLSYGEDTSLIDSVLAKASFRVSRNGSHMLFDRVIEVMSLKNDAALSRFLDTSPCYISRVRTGHIPMPCAAVLVRIHERTGISFKDMRKLLGVDDSVAL